VRRRNAPSRRHNRLTGYVLATAAAVLGQVKRAASACARDWQGQRRIGPTSARTIRVHRAPPFVRGACARLHTRHQKRELSAAALRGEVTSLVRALALHGVARPCRLRSHLASPLGPGRGVLIRSVSRRLGSVAYVREDASPNEVSDFDQPKDARSYSLMSNRRRASRVGIKLPGRSGPPSLEALGARRAAGPAAAASTRVSRIR